MSRAVFDGYARVYNRTDLREERRTMIRGTHSVDLPQGDGKANVAVTRGFKNWFSTREAGLTVESTVTVSITCGQNEGAIHEAAKAAGNMAENLAIQGCEDMGLHFDNFVKDMTMVRRREEIPEEPPRRSEKSRSVGVRRR